MRKLIVFQPGDSVAAKMIGISNDGVMLEVSGCVLTCPSDALRRKMAAIPTGTRVEIKCAGVEAYDVVAKE